MRLQVIEAVCQPAGAVNEDRWGARDDGAVWVLDGATGIAAQRVLPGSSDALWLVERIDAGLRRHASEDAPPAEVLRPIVRQAMQEFAGAALRPDAPPADRPCTSLTLLRLRDGGVELASLGDCRIVHRDAGGATRCFGTSGVTRLDERLVEEVIRLQAQGVPHDQMWPRVLPMTRRHRALMNLPEGYWTLDLSERGLDHVEITRLPAPPLGAPFLLLSDGFYRLVDVYRRYGYDTLLAAAENSGLVPLLDELRQIEADDPACRAHPRLKPRDDATAVLVRLA
ncbi:MAG TPA: protein phosphatase 2C domain-containing protein [Stellaceae bacterium]|nr:protein phosphatase 2C domain-containing protein [Stellaceae bacterium]